MRWLYNSSTKRSMDFNCNHWGVVQFSTLAHELGHLILGHLGPDRVLNVPERAIDAAQQEPEVESVAFLVCARNGVASKSEKFIANYVTKNTTIDHIDLYQVMGAAGQED